MRSALNALDRAVVTEVIVQEMALYGADDAVQFTDPNLNFVQANVLELRTLGGQTFHFSCVQNNDMWGIWPRIVTDERRAHHPEEGMFRTRLMPEFPRGDTRVVGVDPGEGSDIQQICLKIGGADVILRAGEVYENADGTLTVCDRDESVLIFLDGAAYRALKFNAPIYRPFYQIL